MSAAACRRPPRNGASAASGFRMITEGSGMPRRIDSISICASLVGHTSPRWYEGLRSSRPRLARSLNSLIGQVSRLGGDRFASLFLLNVLLPRLTPPSRGGSRDPPSASRSARNSLGAAGRAADAFSRSRPAQLAGVGRRSTHRRVDSRSPSRERASRGIDADRRA